MIPLSPQNINLFGTDGIRGRVGNAPFTIEALPRLARAIALWAQHRYGTNPRIVLGHDTRISSDFVKSTLKSGLLLYPISVYDAHVLPTPALYVITQLHDTFDCALIISASHNPYYDNGIKIIDRTTGKISLEDEQMISDLFYQESFHTSYTTLGSSYQLPAGGAVYSNHVKQFFPANFLNGTTIVLDCAHGATSLLAPELFSAYGAQVITINNHPNGTNINHECGALHLHTLQQAVVTHRATMGFAFDGDGDRVIAVNRHGVVKNGDDILALLLSLPYYRHTTTIVGTIMTNQGFANHLAAACITLLRAPVGDKYVADYLIKNNLIIGGEQSGHIILRDYLDTGDGIFTALRIAEAIIQTNNWDMITFNPYPQILINVPVTVKKELTNPEVAAIIAQSNAQLLAGRLVIRYSGTENLLRIMIEDSELTHAQHIGTRLSEALQKELSTI